ncbi:hypothetical protein EDD17DRAFT_1568573 [Pisolithus thermaeus]|nr:hypothetical protein EDD17DRAFT_1568573 [Pisolithus thermaeus]
MIINLIPPFSYRSISYDINFPCILPFPDLPCPAAWSAQSDLLTAVFRLENATNIHLFDKAVGLAARIREVELNVPRRVIQVAFIDGRDAKFAMNADCVRMLEGVADDVRVFNEEEGQRSSLESSACASTTSSTDDLHSLNKGSSPKAHKSVKHKRQRSLLFSLISSLVPRTLSLSSRPSSPSIAPTDPPQSPLPPAPAAPSCMDSHSHQQVFFPPIRSATNFHRTRARATLVDAWRRHVLPALTLSVHVPPGGYVEWVLHGLVAKTHAEVHGAQNGRSHVHTWKVEHGRSQSEGRNALDLGERAGAERLSRSSSLFLAHANPEDGEDRVVYPRRDQANEWGVRIPTHSPDGLDSYIFELSCAHESLTEESFSHCDDPYGDVWDDSDRFTFDVDRPDSPSMLHDNNSSATLGEAHVHFADGFGDSYNEEASAGFSNPVLYFTNSAVPSDVNEDDDSDESQPSPQTPEDSEELPLSVAPAQLTMEIQQPIPATRTASSRPRSRRPPPLEPSAQRVRDVPVKPQSRTHYPQPSSAPAHRSSIAAWSPKARPKTQGLTTDEFIAIRLEHLCRVYDALNLVHVRSQEEGWRIIRASMFGGPTSWTGGDADRALETKAKRRAWSSGLKIAAPYMCATYRATSSPTFVPDLRSGRRVWDRKLEHSSPSATRNEYGGNSLPLRPPGLPALPPKIRGPVVPTGLSLGKPLRSSPLALYVWTPWDLEFRQGKYGELSLRHIPESLVLDRLVGPGMSCVSFPESPTRTIPVSPTRLFPVCEDSEEEDEVTAGSFVDSTAEELRSDEIVDLVSVTVTAVEAAKDDMIATANILHPLTPPPSYQAAVSVGTSICGSQIVEDGQDVKFDASSILLRPIPNLSVTSAPSKTPKSATQYPCRPPLTSNPPYAPQGHSQPPPQHLGTRRRSISLPAAFSLSFLAPLIHSPSSPEKQTKAPSPSSCTDDGKHNRDCEDLSQAYISPPPSPSGPIIMNAISAPNEQQQYPRYAHVAQVVHATPTVRRVEMPATGTGTARARRMEKRSVSEPGSLCLAIDDGAYGKGQMKGSIPGSLDGGMEDGSVAGGCEVAFELGRAEEGRVVW